MSDFILLYSYGLNFPPVPPLKPSKSGGFVDVTDRTVYEPLLEPNIFTKPYTVRPPKGTEIAKFLKKGYNLKNRRLEWHFTSTVFPQPSRIEPSTKEIKLIWNRRLGSSSFVKFYFTEYMYLSRGAGKFLYHWIKFIVLFTFCTLVWCNYNSYVSYALTLLK